MAATLTIGFFVGHEEFHAIASGKTILSFVGIPLALFGPFLGAYMTYWMHNLGSVTPKKLEVVYWDFTNPLEDLQSQDAQINVIATSGGSKIDNLRIGQTGISNTGLSPILPSEEFEPPSISSKDPWRIINVVSSDRGVKLKWTKVDDYKFSSEPALLNPGDRAGVTVYLTRIGDTKLKDSEQDKPTVSWNARIANLAEITSPQDIKEKILNSGWLVVSHGGWEVIFIVFLFLVYLSISIYLLEMARLIEEKNPVSYGVILAMAALNLCAAEVGTTYLFGYYPLGISAQNSINAPPIILNALVFVGLFLYARSKRVVSHSESPLDGRTSKKG
ncbi:hypothetical protein [Mesorhizobium sp.]|uniref:hypothetical protein n=1 Tax=Mesorhizobium sp. TaxID=1871066 RepID=UPI000FE4358F|nr:hypothetical protein [Mesorhizobium sp.]RWN99368.1 MAG: hypothetical protein EOS06_18430 [Mesorhizobium sp.]